MCNVSLEETQNLHGNNSRYHVLHTSYTQCNLIPTITLQDKNYLLIFTDEETEVQKNCGGTISSITGIQTQVCLPSKSIFSPKFNSPSQNTETSCCVGRYRKISRYWWAMTPLLKDGEDLAKQKKEDEHSL